MTFGVWKTRTLMGSRVQKMYKIMTMGNRNMTSALIRRAEPYRSCRIVCKNRPVKKRSIMIETDKKSVEFLVRARVKIFEAPALQH